MSYNQKKFLDYNGLIHLLGKFDDYPTNDILGTVINSIDTALAGKVDDVQVNSTSVVSNGIANIPKGSTNNFGVFKLNRNLGIATNNNGELGVVFASDSEVKAGTSNYYSIVPSMQHKSVFYGLAKAAGDSTQSASSNAVGTYTESAKSAIQQMLDVPSTTDLAAKLDVAEAGLKVVRLI